MPTPVSPALEDVAPVVRPDASASPRLDGAALRPPAGKAKRARALRGDNMGMAPWLFVGPALLALFLFFGLPVAGALVLSLTDFDIYGIGDAGTARFVGLRNYAAILQSAEFWNALGNTLYFVVAGGPLSVAVSLGAAMLVSNRLVRFKPFWRTVFFAPVVTTIVAVAVVWRYLYHPRVGLLNHVLGTEIDWLGDPAWAMPSIIALAVWKNFGYNMVIFIAGLANIPAELYEAARIDGAGPWARFRYVTVPSLAPTFLFVGLLTMIGYFQLFAEPYVMTQGGPLESTMSVVLLMYAEGFRWWNMGYAAALAFVLFAIILAATLVQMRLQRRADA